MQVSRSLLVLLLGVLSLPTYVVCDGAAYDDAAAADDGGDDGGDDAPDDAYYDEYEAVAEYDDYVDADDYIQYWTDYAVIPKRCITYNNVDVIMYSVHEHGYKQCSDEPLGTYLTTVPKFADAYMNHIYNREIDKGYDDYAIPDVAQYVDCTYMEVGGEQVYVQLGCMAGTSQSIAVNIYSDETCATRYEIEGYDHANIDISEIQIPFKQCQACVVWVDKYDDEIDDQFYEKRQINAPLCKNIWKAKTECNKTCQKMGVEAVVREGWNNSDKILLTILTAFGVVMLAAILQKRRDMSSKDTLLEQAAMTAAGLQQTHVIGIFVLTLVIIIIFASLGMKGITWAMMLILNSILFAYLMKLTVDSSVRQTVVGPDGTIIQVDSCDSSIASDYQNKLVPPTLPEDKKDPPKPDTTTKIV